MTALALVPDSLAALADDCPNHAYMTTRAALAPGFRAWCRSCGAPPRTDVAPGAVPADVYNVAFGS